MMNKNRAWLLVIALALALAACGPAAPTAVSEPAPTIPAASPTPESAAQPTATPVTALEFTSPDFGFSLRYPAGFEVQSYFYHEFVFMAPAGTPGHRERAFLNVELAGSATAEWFAAQVKAENSGLGSEISTMETTLDGRPAYVLGRVPGMNLNRQVFVVDRGILYRFTFMPADPQAGADFEQMAALYNEVMDSLRFLPDRREVPPVTSVYNLSHQIEQALETRSVDNITRPLGDEFTVLYWAPGTPEGATYAAYGRNEAAPFILANFVSQSPDLIVDNAPDWTALTGSLEPFNAYLPGENLRPVLVQGWGPQGDEEAALILAMRPDGSLFWRGVVVTNGTFGD